MYDLDSGPYEVNNLASDPKYAKTKQRLSSELRKWQDKINDKGRIAEDPKIPAKWAAEMKRVYDKRDANRAANWFETHPALGPYHKN